MNIISSKCEKCQKDHDGTYASGRFCSINCSNSRDTDRKIINGKISKALKGRKPTCGGFKKGYDPNRVIWTKEKRNKAAIKTSETLLAKNDNKSWDELGKSAKRRKVLEEQDGKCKDCKHSE